MIRDEEIKQAAETFSRKYSEPIQATLVKIGHKYGSEWAFAKADEEIKALKAECQEEQRQLEVIRHQLTQHGQGQLAIWQRVNRMLNKILGGKSE